MGERRRPAYLRAMALADSLPREITDKFEVLDWRNALAVLSAVHPVEWAEVCDVLSSFRLRWSDVTKKGRGNKSEMAGILDSGLYRCGWVEKQFKTEVVVDEDRRSTPTHEVDCYKNRVALEVEWNNKDPFYDRDLNNFRLLFDLNVIDVGVIITRSSALQRWLHENHAVLGKQPGTYGTSTTHADKLYPRIYGGGAGGCPVVVFAMKPEAYLDDRPTA
jgi:hypothetical protein